MRVTQNMMSNIFVRNLQKQTEAMLQRQEQLASQKRINRPSDDPAGMARVLDGRSSLAAIDQYVENIKQGKSRLEITETTLEQVDDLVQQAGDLARANSGEEITAEQREFAAENIKEIYDHIMQLANSKFGGRYMFSGYQTARRPSPGTLIQIFLPMITPPLTTTPPPLPTPPTPGASRSLSRITSRSAWMPTVATTSGTEPAVSFLSCRSSSTASRAQISPPARRRSGRPSTRLRPRMSRS